MISNALTFLKDHLNAHLSAQAGDIPGESSEDKVVFIDGERMDPLTFKLGAVSLLLINIEQEKILRPPDLYARTSEDGRRQSVQPEIRMNVYALFVARFKQYEQGLSYLSRIIEHFQTNRVFDHHNAPALDESLHTLIMELITLPFSEQNEVWNALRTTYHPSVLYRVKMVAFRDPDALSAPDLAERSLRTTP